MNPLDLAECLEALVKNNRDSFVKDAVQAIRSQYAEIEAHKKTNELLSYRLDELLKKCQWYDDKYRLSTESQHIAPRELSDVEIHYEVDKWERQNNYKHDADVHENLIEFAKAILKKASEK